MGSVYITGRFPPSLVVQGIWHFTHLNVLLPQLPDFDNQYIVLVRANTAI